MPNGQSGKSVANLKFTEEERQLFQSQKDLLELDLKISKLELLGREQQENSRKIDDRMHELEFQKSKYDLVKLECTSAVQSATLSDVKPPSQYKQQQTTLKQKSNSNSNSTVVGPPNYGSCTQDELQALIAARQKRIQRLVSLVRKKHAKLQQNRNIAFDYILTAIGVDNVSSELKVAGDSEKKEKDKGKENEENEKNENGQTDEVESGKELK